MRASSLGLPAAALIAALHLVPAFGGPLQDAMATYQSGDFAAARHMLTPMAEAGDAEAADTLYHIYRYGKGTDIDYGQALAWGRKGAAEGSADAEDGVADAYALGLGVPQDITQGEQWLQKAAADGSAEAELWLAKRYLEGSGVERDEKRGLAYLHAAAGQGSARALTALGDLASLGADGVPEDGVAAEHWYELAAQQGETLAEEALYSLYSPPSIMMSLPRMRPPADPVTAAMWEVLATTTGCNKGKQLSPTLPDLAQLSPTDLAKAKQLAADWVRAHPMVNRSQYDNDGNCGVSTVDDAPVVDLHKVMQANAAQWGGLWCSWYLTMELHAEDRACGVPRSSGGRVIEDELSKMQNFLASRSAVPIAPRDLDRYRDQVLNDILSKVRKIGGEAEMCKDAAVKDWQYPAMAPVLKRSYDSLLSQSSVSSSKDGCFI